MLTSTLRPTMTSLYEMLQAAGCASRELSLSPATFKSSVNAVFDLLREHHISASVIVKLPREAIWYESLEQYRRSSPSHSALYLLKPQTRRELYGDVQDASTRVSASVAEAGSYAIASQPQLPQPPQITDIWLPADNPLRRDFFVLVLSAELQVLLLAYRRPKDKSPAAPDMDGAAPSDGPAEGRVTAALSGLQSFEPECLAAGLDAITGCVEALHPQPPREIAPVLEHWLRLSGQIGHWRPSPTLWTALWSQQLQQQEHLWQANAALRPQAELAEQLQNDSQRLTQAAELKGELSRRVGQELRSPLSSMKTALSILSSQNLKPAQRQRYIDVLIQECDRQNALISGIAELTALEEMGESTQMEPLKLIDIVPGVVSTYQPLAQEQGVMLAYTVPDDLPAVACLGSWLKQIVINLLDNGIKFTPQGGKVWVRAYPKADYIQLECQDTGRGIGAAELDRVFERFYRVRTRPEDGAVGVGLGLAIVQQMVLKCGGSISVESELGQGSTFYLSLPIYRAEAAADGASTTNRAAEQAAGEDAD